MRPLLLVLALAAIGCNKPPEADNTPPAAPPGASQTPGGGGVAPLTGGAGGMTPVVGTESLDGTSGGGASQVIKERARGAAGIVGGGTAPQPDAVGEDSGGEGQ